ncbi:MAG: DUF5703 domain-containing protein [Mangrovibacterium sp.]
MKELLLLMLVAASTTIIQAQDISQYNVVWNSQSKNSSESMPLGGGDIGCNVWVENNDILFYISRSGTFDENSSMLKLGRMRISLSPNPFKSKFRQELKLKQGYIEISGDNHTLIKLWVEVFKPVIHVEVSSNEKLKTKAVFESWRTQDRLLATDERHQAFGYSNTTPDKIPLYTRKDSVMPQSSSLIWYHQDRNSEMIIDREAEQQHLGTQKDKLWNPMKNLIFGGELLAPGMKYTGTTDSLYVTTKYRGWIYESAQPANHQKIDIVLHTAHSPGSAGWLKGLRQETAAATATPQKWTKNIVWWAQFWDRSHIYINLDKKDDKGWEIGRNYNVFRYQLGCNAFGEWPTKFNGGLFVFDADFVNDDYKGKVTPDFRRWGGGSFTAQNQRLVYWPMLKSGDFDMMKSQFEFYNRALKNAELRTKVYWGHAGASFTEQVENSGLPAGHAYERLWGGTTLPVRSRTDSASTRLLKNVKGETMKFIDYGLITNPWVIDHYDGELEFSKMILDYQVYTGADISKYLEFIDASIRFHDEHFQYWSKKLNGYSLDADGKLIMYPGSGLETYKLATNSTSTITGMKTVLTELLELPAQYGTARQRAYWKAVLNRLPAIALREKNGKKTISPAKTWDGRVINTELPQLYPVFPYRRYGVGRPNLQLAVDTWRYGADKENQHDIVSWHPDPIYVADLGLTSEAKDLIIKKLSNAKFRYPTFWGPGLDWAPDHNWGGSGMIALQDMMLQVVGKKIYLLPAWPADWDADVKLHAPCNTTVEAIIKNGKIEKLKVTPQARTKDVIVMDTHN